MCPLIMLPSTRLLMPPASTIPFPIDGYWSRLAGASKLLLFSTRLLMIVSPFCGGFGSESSVLGAIPDMLLRQIELLITRLPPAFVPEKPNALSSETTLVMRALHGWQAPM